MSFVAGVNAFTDALEKRGIRYGIIGGIAVFAYGGERTTFDVDFLIHGQERERVKEVAQELKLNVVNENAEVLQLSGPTHLDVIFANRPKSQEMLQRVRRLSTLPFPVVAPEDLVGLKIQGFAGNRSREFTDKGDILTLFQNVPDLDFDRIKEYAEMFGVWKEIEDLKKRV
jgi:hypothetical protein